MIDFKQVDSIYIQYCAGDLRNDYVEQREDRLYPDGGGMRITVHDADPSQSTDRYQIVFSQSDTTGEILLKGDFFIAFSEIYNTTQPVFDKDGCSFELDASDPNEKMLITFELPPVGKKGQIEPPQALTSKNSPMFAKNYKDDFNNLTTALASRESQYKDADGIPRVYLKFLNGRTVQIEHADLMSDDDLASIFYIHECDHLAIKRYWATVGSVIIFSTGFKFSFPDKNGCEVDLILRRCPDDKHIADEFCSDILTGMQMELESMLDDELKETMEKGFVRLEKLIKQGISNNTSKSSTTRLVPAVKKSRSKI